MSYLKNITLITGLVGLSFILAGFPEAQSRIFLDAVDEKDCVCDRSVPNTGVWHIGFTTRKNPLVQLTDIDDKQKDTIRLEVAECGKVVLGTFSSYGSGEQMRTDRTEDPLVGVVYKGITPHGGVQLRFWGKSYLDKDGKKKLFRIIL